MKTILQLIYINYFIILLNWKKILNVTNNLKRDLEREILFRHMIKKNVKNKLEYNINSINKIEFLTIKNKLDLISIREVEYYSSLNKNKEPLDNVVNLADYRRKKLKKRYK